MSTPDTVGVLAHAQPVTAPAAASKVSEFVFMPAGTSDIQATVNGKPDRVTVNVDAATARSLQADLERLLAGPVVPFFDYDHAGGRRSGLPQSFRWEEGRGVLCQVQWTQAARAAITEGEYGYFSPEFRFNRRTGTVTGLPKGRLSLGGLVNDPAFQAIGAVQARRAGDPTEDPTDNQTDMEKNALVAALVAAGILTDAEASGTDPAAAAVAKFKELKAKCEEKEKEKDPSPEASAEARRITELEKELRTIKANTAKAHVDDAVKAGRIPAKDAAARKFWEESIATQGDTAVQALRALAVNAALTPTHAGSTEPAPSEQDDAAEAESAAISARAVQIAAERRIPFNAAWPQAEAEVKARRN